mmetsp:Transcript_41082/g.97979  ORF Transcript_41082/g.97979 Transcript_41082/m.97979 type:complete len:250 (-) Transcript_41082:662-1411(-)
MVALGLQRIHQTSHSDVQVRQGVLNILRSALCNDGFGELQLVTKIIHVILAGLALDFQQLCELFHGSTSLVVATRLQDLQLVLETVHLLATLQQLFCNVLSGQRDLRSPLLTQAVHLRLPRVAFLAQGRFNVLHLRVQCCCHCILAHALDTGGALLLQQILQPSHILPQVLNLLHGSVTLVQLRLAGHLRLVRLHAHEALLHGVCVLQVGTEHRLEIPQALAHLGHLLLDAGGGRLHPHPFGLCRGLPH